MIQYPLAIIKETGEEIHISDFVLSEHRKELICPKCHGQMIAKALESEKVVSHFAHVSIKDCHGYETVLHDWAKNQFLYLIGQKIILPSILDSFFNKKIVLKIKREVETVFVEYRKSLEDDIRKSKIFIKGWYFKNYFEDSDGLKNWIKQEFVNFLNQPTEQLTEKHEILIESVKVEVPINNSSVIADVLINEKYNIEIFVSHKVDKEKENILRDIGLNTIEIDLSKFEKEFFNKDKIEKIMLNEVSNKKVFGSFEDIRRVKFEITNDKLNFFKNHLIEKAKEMLLSEISSIKQQKKDESTEIFSLIKKDPQQFFIDYAVKGLHSIKDYQLKNKVNEYLQNEGFPILNEDNRQRYAFPLKGIIKNIISENPYNRIKNIISCDIFIEDFNRCFLLEIIMTKKQYNASKTTLSNSSFTAIKNGWHGIELIGLEP